MSAACTYVLVGRWLWHMLIKYWLFVCAALFLGIAIKAPVIFNIVYMLLFLIFLIIFKVSQYFKVKSSNSV